MGSRIELQDIRELTLMASRLEKMLADVHDAFSQRDLNRALAVLAIRCRAGPAAQSHFPAAPGKSRWRAAAGELPRLFMTQALERAGDHAKNLAEEVCHLVSGHSVRHVLRAYDKPMEQMFIDDLKRQQKNAGILYIMAAGFIDSSVR